LLVASICGTNSRLPSAVRTATPAFHVRSSGLFCGRPGGLKLVTRLPARSVMFLWQFLSGPENFSRFAIMRCWHWNFPSPILSSKIILMFPMYPISPQNTFTQVIGHCLKCTLLSAPLVNNYYPPHRFFLAATLVGWIGGDFVYRKVAAKTFL